jgi:hypothetical protein
MTRESRGEGFRKPWPNNNRVTGRRYHPAVRIWITDDITADRDELGLLIEEAFYDVDDSGVQLRVERAKNSHQSFSGRAYPEPPSRPKAPPGTRFFVRLLLPSVLRNRGYPRSYRYTGLVTAPWITVQDWRELLVALAAHEAFHVHQFREGLRRSEVAAEKWALKRLTEWSRDQTIPAWAACNRFERRARQLPLFAASL